MERQLHRSKRKPQKSDDNYKSMIERITDAFISIDTEGYCTYANTKAEEIFNCPRNFLLLKNINAEFHEAATHDFKKAFKKALTFQKYVCIEEYFPLRDVWYEIHFYPSPTGVSVHFRNFTHQKKKDLNSAKLAKRNAVILDMMQNSFLLTTPQLRIVDVNPAFCKTLGYSREELLKMNVKDFDVALSPAEIKENFKKVSNGKILDLVTKNKMKNGTIIDVEVALTELEIDGKKYFASFGRDISQRKRAEKQILNEKELSDSIINSLPGIFYMYDRNGKFLRWNKNFEIISKYSAAEISAMRPLDFFYNDEKMLLKEKIKMVFKKGKSDVEAHFFTKEKEKIPYYFNGSLANIEGKPCLVGMGIDITERNKAHAAIREMEQEILNQKVQQQKKITRAIIKAQETERNYIGRELHDNVNQILAGTKLYLTMAAKRDERIKDLITYPLELINNSIREIRSLTTKYVTTLRNINLKELVDMLIDVLNQNTSINTVFKYHIENEISDDELKLNIYRIIQEEVNNILKHANPSSVLISLKAGVNMIYLTTIDNGTGFILKKKKDGIGISNIINRVESFNGKIEIASSPGNGCCIEIEIPYEFK
jgi:PAS domain S-box-containing protein